MKNYVQAGDTIVVAAPYDRTSGQGAQVGQIFGVCTADAVSGADVALKLTGVFDLNKVGSQAWTVGALVYWDNSNKRCTTVAGGNLFIGRAVATVGNGSTETTGRVLLAAGGAGFAAGANIADLSISAVTGVDGTGSNAASKADVDTAFAAIVAKVNAILTRLEDASISASS